MNPNFYNFTTGEYDDESWRELPDQLPNNSDFTTENIDFPYRSIGEPQHLNELQSQLLSFPSKGVTGSENFGKTSAAEQQIIPSNQIQGKNSQQYQHLKAPLIPFYIGFSQFSLRMSLNELVVSVQNCLDQIIELDYSFLDATCKWDIVYIRGSTYCHFEISVFDENSSPEKYLLEGNRLSGDSLSFRLIFTQIKDVLSSSKSRQISPISPYLQILPVPSTIPSHSSSSSPPSQSSRLSTGSGSLNSSQFQQPQPPSSQLQQHQQSSGNSDEDEQIRKNLEPILAMIDPRSSIDIQLEGIRILCDFTMTMDLHRLLVECNCVERLIELLTSQITSNGEFENLQEQHLVNEEVCCRQYALYAIANMSTFRPCQNILVSNDQFLTYLMNQITNGSHFTAEMRRECARTLANICVGLAPKIVRNLGLPVTMKWIESVDSLLDERLKIHATRAKMYIQNCF